MTIPSAPRLYRDLPPNGAERSGTKEREKEKKGEAQQGQLVRATTCPIFRFQRIFMDSACPRDGDSYKGRAPLRGHVLEGQAE